MFHLGKQFIILIICGCVFLLLLIIGIIVFLNKPKLKLINTFVAVGQGTDTIAWSDDGKIWNKIASGSGFNTPGGIGIGTCVASNGNVWVAGGQVSNATKNMVFSIDNARTWTPVTPPQKGGNYSVYGLVWDGTNFIAVGNGFSGGTTAVWSKDGQKWNSSIGKEVSSGSSLSLFTLGCNQEICVALSWAPACFIIYSDDNGQTWTPATGETFSDETNRSPFVSVKDDNNCVAINRNSIKTNILYSSNGIHWTSPRKNIFNNSNCELYCVAHDNGSTWVVVGNQGIGYSTDNGHTWALAKGGKFTTKYFSSVVYNGKIWVASVSTFILYSSDGINWTKSDTNRDTYSETHLCWNGTIWVSGGYQSPALRWSENVTKPWNLISDTFFKNTTSVPIGAVHGIACRYKV